MGETNRLREIEAALAQRQRLEEIESAIQRQSGGGQPPAPNALEQIQEIFTAGGGQLNQQASPQLEPRNSPQAASQAVGPPQIGGRPIGTVSGALSQLFPQLSSGAQQVGQVTNQIPAELGQAAVQELSQPQNSQALATTAGEMIGRGAGAAAGTALFGPPGTVVGGILGGGLGAVGSLGLQKLSQGEDVKPGAMALEFGLSILPDTVIKPIGVGVRKLASVSAKGREAGENLSGRLIRDRAAASFDSPGSEEIGRIFEMVRQSGAQLDPLNYTRPLKRLTDKSFKNITRTIEDIPAPRGKDAEGFGEGVSEVFQAIRKDEDVSGLDLGTLQHVSSELKKRARGIRDGATADSLFAGAKIIDDGIESGTFIRGGEQSAVLLNARAQWKRFRESEDFQGLVFSRGVTRFSRGGNRMRFNFGRLKDALENPITELEKTAVKGLEANPGARKEITEFVKNVEALNIDIKKPFAFQNTINFLGEILPNAVARARFNSIVRKEKGVISEDALALIANFARRSAVEMTANAVGGLIETFRGETLQESPL